MSLRRPLRDLVRILTLRWMFTRPRVLRALGRLIWIYQASGLEWVARRLKLTALLPARLRGPESLTPRVQRHFSDALIRSVETPPAVRWSAKLRDVHEWLAEIGIQAPAGSIPRKVTYHEACHLCHGQKITRQPRQVLKAIPGLELVELPESTWCCGSAGIYNITQAEMSQKLTQNGRADPSSARLF